ncbi:hypothetical protein D3C81_1340490 [compost metagenome]
MAKAYTAFGVPSGFFCFLLYFIGGSMSYCRLSTSASTASLRSNRWVSAMRWSTGRLGSTLRMPATRSMVAFLRSNKSLSMAASSGWSSCRRGSAYIFATMLAIHVSMGGSCPTNIW